MDAIETIKNFLNKSVYSSIDTSKTYRIGRLFEMSWYKPMNPEANVRIRTVKSIAHKYGLRVSYCMVYRDLEHWEALEQAREEIIKTIPDLITCPVAWCPTEEFGFEKCCFGFCPHITYKDERQFKNDYYPVTKESLETSLEPLWIGCEDYSEKRPEYFFKHHNYLWDVYKIGDDSKYDENLSSDDFAKTILEEFGLIDCYDEKHGIIISDNLESAFKCYALLRTRLSISDFVAIGNELNDFDTLIYTIDNKRIDKISGRHDLFRFDFYWPYWD